MSRYSLANRLPRLLTVAAAAAVPLTGAAPARALQPIDEFVSAAKSRSLDYREAQATAEQRAEEARQAWSRIAPSLSARASYTRNQWEAVARFSTNGPAITITPYDQLDASFTLTVPLVDVGSWMRIGAAGATADAAKLRARPPTRRSCGRRGLGSRSRRR